MGEPCLFSSLQAQTADTISGNGSLLKGWRRHQEREGARTCSAQQDKEAEDISSAPYKPEMVCRKRLSSEARTGTLALFCRT